jgi:hypothetical protein
MRTNFLKGSSRERMAELVQVAIGTDGPEGSVLVLLSEGAVLRTHSSHISTPKVSVDY